MDGETKIPVTHKVEGVVLDELRQRSGMVTPIRMQELMLDNRPTDWAQVSQDHAVKVLEHLRRLSSFFYDFNNIVMSWHESFGHPGINPRGQATITPQLMDRLSREFWKD